MLVVDKKFNKLKSVSLVSHPRIVAAIVLVCYGVDQGDNDMSR